MRDVSQKSRSISDCGIVGINRRRQSFYPCNFINRTEDDAGLSPARSIRLQLNDVIQS